MQIERPPVQLNDSNWILHFSLTSIEAGEMEKVIKSRPTALNLLCSKIGFNVIRRENRKATNSFSPQPYRLFIKESEEQNNQDAAIYTVAARSDQEDLTEKEKLEEEAERLKRETEKERHRRAKEQKKKEEQEKEEKEELERQLRQEQMKQIAIIAQRKENNQIMETENAAGG